MISVEYRKLILLKILPPKLNFFNQIFWASSIFHTSQSNKRTMCILNMEEKFKLVFKVNIYQPTASVLLNNNGGSQGQSYVVSL